MTFDNNNADVTAVNLPAAAPAAAVDQEEAGEQEEGVTRLPGVRG